MMLSRKFFNCKQAQKKVNHCSKKKGKGEKGKAKKNFQKSKPKDVGHFLIQKLSQNFLCMPESQCTKTRCWWQEGQVVVLQTHFRLD